MKRVFVTVGTTRFDDLIELVTSPEAVQVSMICVQHLVLQVGRSSIFPDSDSCHKLTLEAFKFKDSTAEDVKCADLVISHAGAGSCPETLGAGKPLLVVFNDKPMDIHQLELAKQLHQDSHLPTVLHCQVSVNPHTLRTMDLSVLSPFLPRQPNNFANFLDKALGVQ
ncbi:UDP-N-acetylglucosamine transferase subunit ALG13 homolog isoform X2 [Salvelinus namaycush]|uniref:UDP-N-acetylglucosamine transferase subunit ALG13 n=1 Tax=Salvelinus namaycush TaxID=8040 RepID=A0A8U0QVV1_SALNM|nr:UDP-N-acetylglucosamine transferase subunit ALG13 homolog isoform X2 [Salvelinus namaycush]